MARFHTFGFKSLNLDRTAIITFRDEEGEPSRIFAEGDHVTVDGIFTLTTHGGEPQALDHALLAAGFVRVECAAYNTETDKEVDLEDDASWGIGWIHPDRIVSVERMDTDEFIVAGGDIIVAVRFTGGMFDALGIPDPALNTPD